MSSEPPEESVAKFCDISGLGREEAIKRLKGNNNDVEKAIGEFFDDPASTKYQWDESLMGGDREGSASNHGIAFNIQGPDDVHGRGPASYFEHSSSAAPTRPPSRANNRSPQGAPMSKAEEDDDLQRALAQSAAESGVGYETGILEAGQNAAHFGPANRSEYETDQWAMVTTAVQGASGKRDLPPSERQRMLPEPAFLHTTGDQRLGAIITILHNIPMARNILLSCGTQAETYGRNSEWWNGSDILKPEHLAALSRGEQVWGDDAHPSFSDELHRLIAFLDNTERTYGSADSLALTKAIDSSYGQLHVDVEDNLFTALKVESETNPSTVWGSFVSTARISSFTAEASLTETEDEEAGGLQDGLYEHVQKEKVTLLNLSFDAEQYGRIASLYDAFDNLFWTDAMNSSVPFPFDGAKAAFLDDMSDILSIRFAGNGLSKACDIPAIFYVDRYTEARKPFAMETQKQISHIKCNLLQGLDKWERQRLSCKGEQGCCDMEWLDPVHDRRQCLQKFIDTSLHALERQRKNAMWRRYQEKFEQDTDSSKTATMRDLQELHAWQGPYELNEEELSNEKDLETIIRVSKEKLAEVERAGAYSQEKREQCKLALDAISKRLTCSVGESSVEFDEKYIHSTDAQRYKPSHWNAHYKYLLRGVATTSDITYVCVRAGSEPDLIDLEEDPEDNEARGTEDVWWKLQFCPGEQVPISIETIELDEVLLAAGTESRNPILIYSTEAALSATPVQLSAALRNFVKLDNRSFQRELAQEEAQMAEQSAAMATTGAPREAAPLTAEAMKAVTSASPAKRKHSRESSVATAGSRSSRDFDTTFNEHHDPFIVGDETNPEMQHFESIDHEPNKLDGLGEGLADYHDGEHSVMGQIQYPNNMVITEPEMQERGGQAPLITRADGNGAKIGSVNLMDMNIEHEDPTTD